MRINSLTITLPCAHKHGNDITNPLILMAIDLANLGKCAQCHRDLRYKVRTDKLRRLTNNQQPQGRSTTYRQQRDRQFDHGYCKGLTLLQPFSTLPTIPELKYHPANLVVSSLL